jgi:hypothetical protein
MFPSLRQHLERGLLPSIFPIKIFHADRAVRAACNFLLMDLDSITIITLVKSNFNHLQGEETDMLLLT